LPATQTRQFLFHRHAHKLIDYELEKSSNALVSEALVSAKEMRRALALAYCFITPSAHGSRMIVMVSVSSRDCLKGTWRF
jgi:hypothetical protein